MTLHRLSQGSSPTKMLNKVYKIYKMSHKKKKQYTERSSYADNQEWWSSTNNAMKFPEDKENLINDKYHSAF